MCPHHQGAELARWRVKRRCPSFWCILVKLISEKCLLLGQKGDMHCYSMSLIMQVKEMRVSRGASPFITKAGANPIPSPITKVGTSPFIMNADASPIPYIDR
jgi:hypothetical protein